MAKLLNDHFKNLQRKEYQTPIFPENLPSISGRIVNGMPASEDQFPWQAIVLSRISLFSSAICGGSIIHEQWILTAAHCTDGRASWTVSMGSIFRNGDGPQIQGLQAISHPEYNSSNLNNDISLVQLSESVTLTRSIQIIRLPSISQKSTSFAGLQTSVSGFGATQQGGQVSNVLNYMHARVIQNVECASVFGTSIIVSSTICAHGWDHKQQSTCNGDSGGPMVLIEDDKIPTQIGVVSFVSSAGCTSGNPHGYVRTSHYVEWIYSVTGIKYRQ